MDRIKPEIQNESLNSLEICTEYNAKVGNESRQKEAVGQFGGECPTTQESKLKVGNTDEIGPELQNKSLDTFAVDTENNAKVGNESQHKEVVGQSGGV